LPGARGGSPSVSAVAERFSWVRLSAKETPTSENRLFEYLLADVRSGAVRGKQRTFARGEVVFHEGDPGDTLHLIVVGLFAVRTATPAGRNLIINVLGPGDVVGE